MVEAIALYEAGKQWPAGSQDVRLLIGGRRYGGWTDVTVVRSMEAGSGQFEIAYTAGISPGRSEIKAGERCVVELAGQPVITGWVDRASRAWAATGHSLSVSGRDASGDLVDCTAVHAPAEWRGLKLEDLAAILAAPFGVAVTVDVETGARFPAFRLEHGETAWEAIERACRLRACLAMPSGDGGLTITRAGESGAASGLLTGGAAGNVLSWSLDDDHADRYSLYRVLAQRPGSDDEAPADYCHVRGEARDSGITRYRPLMIPAEDVADQPAAAGRAEWEAAIRRARGLRARASVVGWMDGAGALWRPNTRVRAGDPWGGDREWIIATVRYTLSDGGTITEMELADPDAYLPDPSAGPWPAIVTLPPPAAASGAA